MKQNKISYMMMAAAMLMTACTAEQEAETVADGSVPITLGYTLQETQTTRTVTPDINDTYIAPGGQVYVNITTNAETPEVVYDGKYLVTKATTIPDGESTKDASEMAPMNAVPFYPSDGTTVNIKAYYPASAGSSFTVLRDQSTDEGYAASDLMWAAPITNQAMSFAPVNLNFTHMLTKIVINVTAVESIGNITAIRLTGIKPTVSFNNTTDGEVGEASGTATTIVVAKGDNLLDTDRRATCTAIIPAQAIDGTFVQIVTTGGTANYTVNKTFVANSCYTANINVGASNINVTNSISEWNQESFNPVGGYVAQSLGELTNIINAGGAFSEYLGKYVKADGTISSSDADAIGRIAYMSTSDVDEDIPGSRILVLAIDYAATDVYWKTTATAGESEWNDISKNDGYAFTISHCNETYPAAYHAYNYNTSVQSPPNASIWFLPSYNQLTNMLVTAEQEIITNSIWTTTEATNAAKAYYYSFDNHGWSLTRDKASENDVRTCFAYPNVYASLTNAHLGQVITSDGGIYYDNAAALAANKTPIAMIIYVGENGESSPYNHGLAIALSDDTGTAWGANDINVSITHYGNVAGAISDVTGIYNTNTIINENTISTAAGTAKAHASIVPGCSQWFLPTSGQWIKVLNHYGAGITESSNNNVLGYLTTTSVEKKVYTSLNNDLYEAGGSTAKLVENVAYWTSTEYSKASAIPIGFMNSSGEGIMFGNGWAKTGHFYVRAFLAF